MQMQLPAHLQGRQVSPAVARATEGMGSSLPPHISIQGNKFTFIDASGNEAPPMLTFDGYIVDVSDHTNKRYYDKKFDPSQNSYEPPACWSANGIAPSREATKPQSPTCESCPHNVRGSATSLNGVAIKACRDEKWLAVVNPHFGEMMFQLVITPGSFSNFKSFCKVLENYGVGFEFMLVRFAFEDKTNGVLNFTPINWTAPEHLTVIDRMLAEKKQDAIVGRLDQPRQGALPAPNQGHQTALPPNQLVMPDPRFGAAPGGQTAPAVPVQGFQQPQQEIIPPGQQVNAPFGAAPNAAAPSMQQGGLPAMGAGFPSTAGPAGGFPSNQPQGAQQAAPQQQPTQRRRRNAAAQNAAPAAPQAQQPGFGAQQGGFQPSAPPAGGPVQAPFGQPQAPSPQFGAPNAANGMTPSTSIASAPGASSAAPLSNQPQNNFGIGGGAQVPGNPEVTAMLTNMFNQQRQ